MHTTLQQRPKDLKVVVGTWNVNEKQPIVPDSNLRNDLREWLQMNTSTKHHNEEETDADIVAIALQEIDMRGTALVQEETSKKQQWEDALEYLMCDQPLVLLHAKQLVGMCLFVYVRKQHVSFVDNRSANIQREGLFSGALGNKGSVSIRFDLYDRSFCFINVHLTAHMKNVEARNANLQSILQKTSFFFHGEDNSSGSGSDGRGNLDRRMFLSKSAIDLDYIHNDQPLLALNESEDAHDMMERERQQRQRRSPNQGLHVQDHDFIFIAGDFNYRIEAKRGLNSAKDVVLKIKDKRFRYLQQMDQLSGLLKRRQILQGYTEGTIDFAPTYKFTPGTDEYSTKKNRVPSFCDRIFYRSTTNDLKIRQLSYGSGQSKLSDHKPVFATFIVPLLLSTGQVSTFFDDNEEQDISPISVNEEKHVEFTSLDAFLQSDNSSISSHNSSNSEIDITHLSLESKPKQGSLPPPPIKPKVLPPPPPKNLLQKRLQQDGVNGQLDLPPIPVSFQRSHRQQGFFPLTQTPERKNATNEIVPEDNRILDVTSTLSAGNVPHSHTPTDLTYDNWESLPPTPSVARRRLPSPPKAGLVKKSNYG